MDASGQFEALVPQPLDAEGLNRRRELEDIHEELLLSILALEEEWQLDNRIAFLSNLPTLVLGISSMNRTSSGSHQRATWGRRNSNNSSCVSRPLKSGLGTT